MEYTVQKLADLSGLSGRTLRFYDEIGLLKPAKKTESGYRLYAEAEVNRLQQILFYKELGLDLEKIRRLLDDPSFEPVAALKEHRQTLLRKRKQLDCLLTNLEKTIEAAEGRRTMNDQEKFEGFKQQLIEDNEEKYGQEARALYGNEMVDESQGKMKKMTQQEYEELQNLEKELFRTLSDAMKTGNPASERGQHAAELHKQWLSFYWNQYSKEAHAALTDMYVADVRFKAYYERHGAGMTNFLRDAVHVYTKSER